ncbi:putative protocatechuatedioxygenase subunit beta [Phaeomoniella chlamydospora]|uniref:Putative protocatechuatedioxygenase subunit beta n=1 Tax=Phaeomoniella chlamydospora TaxID=158046 RepID=A0A0G2E3G7_PHACM|nr:putative protocatechuatedioxygenase subunit beta [Phaeomoniella chlamydospora]
MGKVVAAVGLSHAPGALAFPETAKPEHRASTEAATRALGMRLESAKPDVIFAFLDDHFENFFRNLSPSITMGIADSHVGPADQWMETLRIKEKTIFPGAPEIAEKVLSSVVHQGFDVARAGPCEYGNNLLMPWKLMGVEESLKDVAIVPIFINVFTPPLIPYARAYALGEAVRAAVETALPETLRAAFICTGGLSHWPPYWSPVQGGDPPSDPFLQRIKRYQTEGKSYLKQDPKLFVDFDDYEVEMAAKNEYPLNSKHPLVNADWDRKFMDHYSKGDSEWMKNLTYEEVEEEAGHGGHEVLNWVAMMGAMKGAPSKMLLYEPVIEWICGMVYQDFEVLPLAN